jgi:hypothetical protein
MIFLLWLHNYYHNLNCGLTTKAGFVKVQVENEAQESHFMLPRVQRVWGNEHTHGQVGSHFEN